MKKKKKLEFSKWLIIFETVLVSEMTVGGLMLAYEAIRQQLDAALPWITAEVTAAWAAYGFSAKYYYSKALAENCKGGITYDKAFETIKGGRNDQDNY